MSTFANSDTYGSNGISQFQISAADYGVTILSSNLFPVGQTNFAVAIADALKTGARIFVFFMAAADAGYLIAQGYTAGLFFEGTLQNIIKWLFTFPLSRQVVPTPLYF